MHFCLLPLSLFAIVFTGGFSLVDDLTAFDLGDPFLTIDSNLASNDLLAWDDSPMGETSLGTNNKNNDDLFPPWTESESLDLDDDLLTADSCPSTNNGLSRRNDDNTHPACSTTPNNQVKVPDLPTTLDDLTNQINYPSFPRLHVVDPVVRDLMRSNVQLLDEKNCVPDSPFYLCCLCDPNAAFMVCLDCVPGEFFFFFSFKKKMEGRGYREFHEYLYI